MAGKTTTSTNKKTAHTEGYDTYDDVRSAYDLVLENWNKMGKTDKYSTGFPILDQYLGGGYGLDWAGEVVLIHSTSKTYKSTFMMQLIRTPLEQGEKVGCIILEGDLSRTLRNLRQLYAPVEINGKVQGYERFDEMATKLEHQIFAMSKKMKFGNFSMDEIIDWMKKAVADKQIKLFVIDPIGYLSDYSSDWNIPDYKKESKFMKELVQFADDTKSTVICLQHNTKGNENGINQSHREAAIGGSQAFSKSPTKVIEMRNEGYITNNPNDGKLISLEMYMARDVRDWRGQPVLLEVRSHPDGIGRFFSMRKYDELEAHNILSPEGKQKSREARDLWHGQYKGDLEELTDAL